MDEDLADSDIDINLDELDGILTFEDSDNDLTDDININDLNNGMNAISLHVDVGRDERGSEYDGMGVISLYDEFLDKEDEIWVEGEAQESVLNEMENIHSSDSDEEGRTMWHVFNAERDMKNPKFHHGMLFTNKEVLKQAIRQYGIVNKYNVKVVRDEKDRINAKCLNCEGWMIRASINKKEHALQIKKLKDNHRCAAEIPQKYITYKWLSETYREHLRADPKLSSKSMAHQLEVDFKAKTCRLKLWRAKKHALEKLRRSEAEQYGKLRDYAEELKKTNPNSSVFIGSDHLIFQNMYVCIDACKRGFVAGCRPLVGLDGCFLKGRYKAQLLVAVGIDPNDCIFPIGYGVVDVESRESWTWFVRNLSIDLNIENSGSWTFMSDKEKVLFNYYDLGVDCCFILT